MALKSEQDLAYAAEFRGGVHAEALARVRREFPDATEVVDAYPVEAYCEDVWEYPGKWYTYVAVPPAAGSRKKLIDTIVKDTLEKYRREKKTEKPSEPPEIETAYRDGRYAFEKRYGQYVLFIDGKRYALSCSPYEPCLYICDENGERTAVHNAFDPSDLFCDFSKGKTVTAVTGREYTALDFCRLVEYAAGRREIGFSEAERGLGDIPNDPPRKKPSPDDPFFDVIAAYPDSVLDYAIVGDVPYRGSGASHRAALARACDLCMKKDGWTYDAEKARGNPIPAQELFTSHYPKDKLNYRKAFLYPPHESGYTGADFVRVNAALFPKGTDELEVYEWTTDWSDYFDEGHEWWGALCLTIYDKRCRRFVAIFASATD